VTLTLPVATNDTAELLAYALCGVEHIFQAGFRYKKAGVLLTELVPAQQIQLSLFDTKDRERSARLMTAMDYINAQMGAGTIRYAAVGFRNRGSMRHVHGALRRPGICLPGAATTPARRRAVCRGSARSRHGVVASIG
jgi:hypothetical protein